MLISYCTTCAGRLWQLRDTLPQHLQVFRGRKNVELIVLDYNSHDGLEQWMRECDLARGAMRGGLLRYAKEGAATAFNSSKAKNLAHRLARGKVLVNLDADNWAIELDPLIRETFARSGDIVCHAYNQNRDGSFGRIALRREWFYALGGYDESLQPVGHQDADLLNRAIALGLRRVDLIADENPIPNSHFAKVALTGRVGALRHMIDLNRACSDARVANGEIVRNGEGWGSAVLSLNFGKPRFFRPIKPFLKRRGFKFNGARGRF